jgi:uncharacterized OB-fold protein
MRRLAAPPTVLSAAFWQAATEHRFLVPRCNRTGRYFFPPERCVPGTDSTDWSYVESTGIGTVTTFTVVHRPPSADFDVPYVLAVVTLDEGWDYLTNIVDCDPQSVTIGMPVKVTYLDVEDASLPVFTPLS